MYMNEKTKKLVNALIDYLDIQEKFVLKGGLFIGTTIDMESEIRTIKKERMKRIKEMSPYQIDEIFLLGFGLLNNKEGEENDEETETLR